MTRFPVLWIINKLHIKQHSDTFYVLESYIFSNLLSGETADQVAPPRYINESKSVVSQRSSRKFIARYSLRTRRRSVPTLSSRDLLSDDVLDYAARHRSQCTATHCLDTTRNLFVTQNLLSSGPAQSGS